MAARQRPRTVTGTSLSSSHVDVDTLSKSEGVTDVAMSKKSNRSTIFALLAAAAATTTLVLFVLTSHFPVPSLYRYAIVTLSGGNHLEYAVIMDAGSTGTRVIAFTFDRTPSSLPSRSSPRLKVVDQLWKEVKPGLATFADEPARAREVVQELLEAARGRVPKDKWASTPVTLKATGGFRLLPRDKRKVLLDEVADVLGASGFRHPSGSAGGWSSAAEVMNPLDEGLFSWFTVNVLQEGPDFLAGGVEGTSSSSASSSYVTLDLGGASTQITTIARPSVESDVGLDGLEGRKHFLHDVLVAKGAPPIRVYSHSYLGLGLMSAREAALKLGQVLAGGGPRPAEAGGVPPAPLSVASPCVSLKAGETKSWSFNGNSYLIQPAANVGFEDCLATVKAVVAGEDVHRPAKLNGQRVAAISYFYDLVDASGEVPPSPSGWAFELTVGDYASLATRACRDPSRGFDCLDLTYAYAMLKHGYGFEDDKTLSLFKKIAGYDCSWALGVAYSLLEASA